MCFRSGNQGPAAVLAPLACCGRPDALLPRRLAAVGRPLHAWLLSVTPDARRLPSSVVFKRVEPAGSLT